MQFKTIAGIKIKRDKEREKEKERYKNFKTCKFKINFKTVKSF